MKRILFITLAVLLSTLSASAFEFKGINYTVIGDKSVGVVKGGYYNHKITIPEQVTYCGKNYYVTKIWSEAFIDCKELTSISIPNTVTEIGDWAFRGCTQLTSVNIPNYVTKIGEMTFYECEKLHSVTIPNFVEEIGGMAFYGCI